MDAENPKKPYSCDKKIMKNDEKKLFFRNVQNYTKITKKVGKSKFGSTLVELQPIFGRFLRGSKSPIEKNPHFGSDFGSKYGSNSAENGPNFDFFDFSYTSQYF